MAADDVMRESAGPALAGVTGAHGEDLAAGTQGDRTRVPLARRDHLEPGAVGPDPDHASARKLDAPPVFADSPGSPLVAHGQVEIAVNARSNASGDVVVDSLGGKGHRAQAADQLDPLIGPAVAVCVAERRQFGWMDDIERAVDPFQAADGAQPVGEDAALAVLDGQDRTTSDARRAALLHRALAEVDRAVGSHDDGCRIANTGCPGRQLDRPAGRRLRQGFPLRLSRPHCE